MVGRVVEAAVDCLDRFLEHIFVVKYAASTEKIIGICNVVLRGRVRLRWIRQSELTDGGIVIAGIELLKGLVEVLLIDTINAGLDARLGLQLPKRVRATRVNPNYDRPVQDCNP